MTFFTKQETLVILLTLLVIFIVSFFNFKTSLRRQRDSERKNDLGFLTKALDKYLNDFGEFPVAAPDGKIVACTGTSPLLLVPCEWGKNSDYLSLLPIDPKAGEGYSYLYISNGRRYQIYATLEGQDEAEYDPKIVARNLHCGTKICNFGRSFGKTPLDKSLEEYENEINAKY